MQLMILLGVLITLATSIPVILQMRKHPKGLIILFFAEMWERFSYYGMRAILMFYLTKHFLFDQKYATGIYGSYTSLVYLLPLVGGLIADRYLGTRKAIAFGALLLVAGHGMMAIEGPPAQQHLTYQGARYEFVVGNIEGKRDVRLKVGEQTYAFGASEAGGLEIKGIPAGVPLPQVLPKGSYEMAVDSRDPTYTNIFFLALSLIIMGVGFLKPNISTVVGQLYPQGDPRRDPGFTLYYYGINLGAFWASILCGWLGESFGWGWGFGLAGVGMLAGFIVFVLGKPLLQGKGEPPNPALLKASVVGPFNRENLIYICALAGVAVVWFMVQRNALVGTVLIASTVLSLAFIGWFLIFKCEKIARERMMLAMVLVFGAVVFFTLFEQAGTSLNLFADQNVDLGITSAASNFNIFGHHLAFGTREQVAAAGLPAEHWWQWVDTGINAGQTQSFNAGYILIFAPVFAAMWTFLAKRNMDPNPVMKFGLGLLQVGLGFMVIVWGAGMADGAWRLPLVMLGLLYLLHTTGELFLSPVGMAEITKLSVASVVSFMMAVWFLSSSIAQYVGGWIAGLTATETVAGQVLDPKGAFETSVSVFGKLGWAGIAIGVIFIAVSFLIKHWSHGSNDSSGHPAPEPDQERRTTP